MADYGLITKNEYGGTQIDSTFQNFVLQESKNVTLYFKHNDFPYNIYEVLVPIPSSPIPPLIAIRPNISEDYYVAILGYTIQEGNYNGMYITSGTNGPSTTGVYWIHPDYIVTRAITLPTSGSYGMVVYNSNGDICFHSNYKYLKILSAHNIVLEAPIPYKAYYPYVDVNHSGIYNPYYILTPNFASVATFTVISPRPPIATYVIQLAVGLKRLTSEKVRVGSFRICTFYKSGYPVFPGTPIGWTGQFTLLTCTV